ncbi:triose-phosphate isomerase [Chitinimonas taiwanensis]|uniref:Triosephosphate isomerase n=1 Tax=Chitinimonas taiwanensis DSM 18899 TaxID=1121279 RepID=A0A1K2HFB3_9NEIS|nr:triose-phosphate isomerase [Chitinimonas taiwanensis]SFZ75341.1 triosephosphate isomerase [Chitinimonas taiwanensis DSM 18899]
MTQAPLNALVVGNWKMNGSLATNATLLEGLRAEAASFANITVSVCPPFPYLAHSASLLAGSAISCTAQNLCHEAAGAYTGEVAASMLAELGCRYVLAGHSERRAMFGDSSERVAAKTRMAFNAGLIPIVCVGETLAQREAGQTEATLSAQLLPSLASLSPAELDKLVLAYEPVWAIGTGHVASAEQISSVLHYLRALVASSTGQADIAQRMPVLYGGSVNPASAQWLAKMPEVSGVLVGGASLNARDFSEICRSFAQGR